MKKTTLMMLILFTMTLQGQNKLLSSIEEYYDGSTWENIQGSNYEYDSHNNLIIQTYFSWNLDWEISMKVNYTYNVNNKVTEDLYQFWNSTSNQLENFTKNSYTYTSGKPAETINQKWENNQWVNKYKYVYTYNNDNLPILSMNYAWDGLQWVNDDRETLTYNANNKVAEILSEDRVNSEWKNDYKYVYTYDVNNKISTEITYKWNGSWGEEDRTEYVFDSNGNMLSQTGYYLGNSNDKTEYIYDFSSFMSNFIHPFNDKTGFDYFIVDFPYVNKLLSTNGFIFNSLTNSFEINNKTTYNYDNAIVLSNEQFEIENKKIIAFPNPAKSYIEISGLDKSENYKIYTVSGIEVDKVTVSDNEKIDIQKLSNGFYFLKFNKGRVVKILKKQ